MKCPVCKGDISPFWEKNAKLCEGCAKMAFRDLFCHDELDITRLRIVPCEECGGTGLLHEGPTSAESDPCIECEVSGVQMRYLSALELLAEGASK